MSSKWGISAVLVMALALGACSIHGGTHETIHPPTLGQELVDLKRAFEAGALDESEYQRQRERLIESERTKGR
ncbi:hypothetical protein OOT55_13425 [Marinimicrobium sp. C6131]|uniref:hypothetical protein n=1 Tax=Marinimicrobium sp. C6131 TaxID=3022676 RepID=UPI00223D75BD|nr:hypothetical protein [Marinimicrobium sp. C6131]UZJ43651.1 hypothetical protein OOT55_13425 [Marinimicrobium sp. C6131]